MKSVVVPAVIAGLVAFATPAHADDTPPPVLVDAVADCHHLTYTVSNLLADDMVIEEFGSAPPGNIRPDANGVASHTLTVAFTDTVFAADVTVVRHSTHEMVPLFHQDFDCTTDPQVIPVEVDPPAPVRIPSPAPRRVDLWAGVALAPPW